MKEIQLTRGLKPIKIDVYPVGQDNRYEILVNGMFVWDWTGLRQAEHCAHNLARAVPKSTVNIHADIRRGAGKRG